MTGPPPCVTIGTILVGTVSIARRALALGVLVAVVAGVHAAQGGRRLHARVGLVLEIGYLDDPFQHIAYAGLQRAVRELGVEGKVAVAPPNGDFRSPFVYLAHQHYDLIIGVGFLETAALDEVARKFPHQKFAILDASVTDLTHEPRNVLGTHFRTEEGSYLAGYLAALLARAKPGPQVLGTVGGVPIPPVQEYIAGFRAGAVAANPSVRLLNGYSNDFQNQAKCRAVALQEIGKGAQTIFQVADECGLGALAAARAHGRWGVGVDVDESYLGSRILTSVVKRLDVAVYDITKSYLDGRFHGGSDAVFGLADGGVGLGRISPKVPAGLLHRLDAIRAAIVSGRIKVPARL